MDGSLFSVKSKPGTDITDIGGVDLDKDQNEAELTPTREDGHQTTPGVRIMPRSHITFCSFHISLSKDFWQ